MIYKIIYMHILLDNIPHHYCTNKMQTNPPLFVVPMINPTLISQKCCKPLWLKTSFHWHPNKNVSSVVNQVVCKGLTWLITWAFHNSRRTLCRLSHSDCNKRLRVFPFGHWINYWRKIITCLLFVLSKTVNSWDKRDPCSILFRVSILSMHI